MPLDGETPGLQNNQHTPDSPEVGSILMEYSLIQLKGELTDSTPHVDHSEDDYSVLLKSRGINLVYRVPLLEFKFVNRKELETHVKNCDCFTGLLFSSVRAVESLAAIFNTNSDADFQRFRERWSQKDIFCVGPKTVQMTEELLGFKSSLGQNPAGNSQKLAFEILDYYREKKVDEKSQKLLFPCSSIARDELPKILTEHGIQVLVQTSYETCAVSDASERLKAAIERTSPSTLIILFFSPSNVMAAETCLKEVMLSQKDRLRLMAIGYTTRDALIQSGLDVWCTSRSPSPSGVFEAIYSTSRNEMME